MQEARDVWRALERALRSRARHWLVDPQSGDALRDCADERDWQHYCVPYVANFLGRPATSPLVDNYGRRYGGLSPDTAAYHVAIGLRERAWRVQRRSRQWHYQWLRRLQQDSEELWAG